MVYSIAPFSRKAGDHLGHAGGALADGAIDAQHILTALVEYGVERDRGLAGLPVAEDQLALAAADRDERVDDLDAGLQGHGDRRAVHDVGGGAFDRQARAGKHRAIAIQGPSHRIDDASDQAVAHRHIHHMPSAFDFVAGVQLPVVAQQNGADFSPHRR